MTCACGLGFWMIEATSAPVQNVQKWDPLRFPRINCWTHHHLLRGVLGRQDPKQESWGFWSQKQQISESSTGYMAGPGATTTGPWLFFQGWIWNFASEHHEVIIKHCVFAACFRDSQQHGQQQLIPEVPKKNFMAHFKRLLLSRSHFTSLENFSDMNFILPIWGFLDQSSSLLKEGCRCKLNMIES